MLDRLRGGKQAGVKGGCGLILIHDFLALIDEAHDGGTGLALRRFIDRGKHLFGPSVSPKCFSNAAFAALFYCVGCPT